MILILSFTGPASEGFNQSLQSKKKSLKKQPPPTIRRKKRQDEIKRSTLSPWSTEIDKRRTAFKEEEEEEEEDETEWEE